MFGSNIEIGHARGNKTQYTEYFHVILKIMIIFPMIYNYIMYFLVLSIQNLDKLTTYIELN